jgi:diguanylate cyclase (GGDEF)-like protein
MADLITQEFEDKEQNSQDFLEENATLLHDLDITWREAIKGEWNASAINRIKYLLHKLIGTSHVMGYAQTESVARNLKESLDETDIFQQARDRIQEIEIEFETLWQVIRSERPKPASGVNEAMLHIDTSDEETAEREHQLIYLAEDDTQQSEKLAAQIGYFGYQVKSFRTLEDLKRAVGEKPPKAILMDIIFPESPSAGLEAAREILEVHPNLPVIFISVEDKMEIRLQAVKAGGVAYFTKPVNISTLIDTLDRYTSGTSYPIPYRVLLIEDSRFQATFYAKKLQNAGMQTRILTNPMEITKTLRDFNPDLILLDMYMPVATGMELARVIRQIETYLSIPIVYLSAETDKDKQLEAMKLGGDDFLDKSIKPEHLISAVATRAARYRELRAMMMRDSLTGLLNHTTIKERLEQEVLRADRNKLPLAYAMIDIDHFKQVNDTHGHAAGDRVLKSLSRLLAQRLRRTDVIGRYGGEEFAIILPNTPINDAVRVMEELRQGFANLRHQAETQEFSVTFSCGIASHAGFNTPGSISEAADKALYIAKRQGRNQTICADFIKK